MQMEVKDAISGRKDRMRKGLGHRCCVLRAVCELSVSELSHHLLKGVDRKQAREAGQGLLWMISMLR